jgi:hypothetical protein
MTSLLHQHSHGNAPAVPPHGRGSILKIPQYTLQDVKFVEELGKKILKSYFKKFKIKRKFFINIFKS